MKEIKAYIKPHKLSAVTLALHRVEGLSGMSVTTARGFGRGRAKDAPQSIRVDLVDFLPVVKIEIVCSDDLVEAVIDTIRSEAHTGLRGDGKIYVAPIEDAVRISTGERGQTAI